jgi:transcriptional regulator of acetoin/glycerol metabolism
MRTDLISPFIIYIFILVESFRKEIVKISSGVLRQLMDYHWPGNVRELENIIERALVIGSGKEIMSDDLPFSRKDMGAPDSPKSLKMMEKAHIIKILEQTKWNISKAARELDIDRQTLYNKMNKYAIQKGEP